MANITFTQQQIDTLSSITSNGTTDFYAGYDYLSFLLSSLTPVEITSMGATQAEVNDRLYWLGKASAINQNDLSSDANNFIRDVTRYGLLWDEREIGQIQANSDGIGYSVMRDILDSNGFPLLGEIIARDVGAAVHNGGQTYGVGVGRSIIGTVTRLMPTATS